MRHGMHRSCVGSPRMRSCSRASVSGGHRQRKDCCHKGHLQSVMPFSSAARQALTSWLPACCLPACPALPLQTASSVRRACCSSSGALTSWQTRYSQARIAPLIPCPFSHQVFPCCASSATLSVWSAPKQKGSSSCHRGSRNQRFGAPHTCLPPLCVAEATCSAFSSCLQTWCCSTTRMGTLCGCR